MKDHLKILAFTNKTTSHMWRFDPIARRMNEQTEHEMFITEHTSWDPQIGTNGANIVIMEMLSSNTMVDTCKNMGAKVIYEADDAVLDTYGRERKNLMTVDESFRSSAIETIRKCDALTVATPTLKKSYERYTDAPIYVLPILMDFDYYADVMLLDMPERNTDEIRIGWFGSKGHYEDLKMVIPALKRVLDEVPEAKFVYAGFGGMESDSLVQQTLHGEDWFEEIPRERREFYQMAPAEYWKYRHRFMDIDVAISPLIDDEFNKAKSPTKFLEYAALKTPAVMSPTVYGDIVKHNKTGLIAKTEKDWYNHIKALVVDEKKRQQIAENAYEDVFDNYNIENRWMDFVKTYEKILG